eukprot:GEMP01069724.1.p1 GENE.GEMP01069724.1~~GEMP01069724.1.p1  ORF type:complete len:310 (+),score=62.08 GEMP01069724.1:56-931(+)
MHHPSVVSYNAVMSACEKGAQWERALSLFHHMITAKGIHPTVISYNAVISACAKGAQWTLALALLRTMRHTHKLKPNDISYNAAVSACEKAANWASALSLLRDMRQDAIPPNTISYSAAISACDRGGAHWVHALHLFATMQHLSIHRDTIAYVATISALEHSNQHHIASALYRDAYHATLWSHWKKTTEFALFADFHSYPASVAKAALRFIITEELFGRRKDSVVLKDVVLIVGRGLHTKGDPKLKRELMHMLAFEFVPPLVGTVPPNNSGAIRISAGSIQRWIEHACRST